MPFCIRNNRLLSLWGKIEMLNITRVLYDNLLNKNKNLQDIMQCYFYCCFWRYYFMCGSFTVIYSMDACSIQLSLHKLITFSTLLLCSLFNLQRSTASYSILIYLLLATTYIGCITAFL